MSCVSAKAEKRVCKDCGEPAHRAFGDLCEECAREQDRHVCYACGENEGEHGDPAGWLCDKCLVDTYRPELESALGISIDPKESYDVVAVIWAYATRYYVVPPGQEPETTRELMSRLREAYRIEPGLTNAWVRLQEWTGEELIILHFYEGDPSRRRETVEGLFTPEVVEELIEDWEEEEE